ncbi:MAG: formylglycine-generating enzyme family protein, partial [Thermoguttaceae bacterium]
MTQAFNPYHKWLGIPPEEQPANHYRLLGIAVFESDPDVIEAAADQRMAHLRNYQAGKHSELSQKLLNEVAAAKICLLNPQKRADYDASLRAEIEAKAAETTPPSPVALDPALVDLFEAVEPSKAVPSACVVGNRQSVSLPVLGAIVLGGLLILGLVAWIATPSRESPATQTEAVEKSEPAQPQPTQPPPVHTIEPAKPTPVVQENPSQSKTTETPAEPKPSAPVHCMPIGPLDAAAVRALQERGANEQSVPWETANSIGMKLVFVPAGEFEMGSTSAEIERWLGGLKDKKVEWQRQLLPTEAPRHRVKITRPFYLGAYEVTQAEYQQVIGRNPSAFSAGGQQKAAVEGKDTGRHPVENVSWEDAMEFCRKLSDSPEEKTAGRVYRLPTEAEWEYACRAGTCAQWNCGDDPATLREVAWFAGCNSGVTHPVGQKSPNALGAYDLHGNVTEWCMDWAGPDYYAYSPANDPQGISSGSARVFRGGGWWSEPVACRSAFRSSQPPMVRHYVQGFRVVCTPGRQVTPEGTPATASSLPDRKPVARWTFDDPKNPGADSSGSGCHGKVFEATYVPDGKAGGALNFQGKGGIDFEPSSLPKSLDFKEMSISWWGNVSPDCPAWSDWWAVANSKIWLVGEVNGKCPEGPYGAPSLYGPGPVAGN